MRVVRRGRFTLAVLTAAAGLVFISGAFAAPPGQRLSDYVASHARSSDRVAIVGVSLDGGHTTVVNGRPVARGVLAVIHTRLADSSSASFVAQRLCAVASVAVKRLGLAMIGGIEVHTRDGTTDATSFYLGLPVCRRAV